MTDLATFDGPEPRTVGAGFLARCTAAIWRMTMALGAFVTILSLVSLVMSTSEYVHGLWRSYPEAFMRVHWSQMSWSSVGMLGGVALICAGRSREGRTRSVRTALHTDLQSHLPGPLDFFVSVLISCLGLSHLIPNRQEAMRLVTNAASWSLLLVSINAVEK